MKYLLFIFVSTATITALSYQQGTHEQEAINYWTNRCTDYESAQGHYSRALMLYNLFEFELALEHIEKALQMAPNNPTILHTKGVLLRYLGRFAEAIPLYEQFITQSYNLKSTYYGLHLCLQATGNLKEAYIIGQKYRILAGLASTLNPINPSDIKNKTVLIIGECGFGDQIQYLRFASVFKKWGAAKVIIACDKKLVPLFSLCPFADQVISFEEKTSITTDLTFMQDQLLFLLQTDLDEIPQPIPYINIDQFKINKNFPYPRHSKDINIGICWNAKQGLWHELTPYFHRTMPLSLFEPISKMPNVKLYSLLKGPGEDQIKSVSFKVEPLPANFDTTGAFIDTVAFMKNLDLIITVDTSIAHLAGAIGLPVWVLLTYTSDARWMLDRSDTPWYPTMRLFRQKSPANWTSNIDQVIIALNEFINHKNKL